MVDQSSPEQMSPNTRDHHQRQTEKFDLEIERLLSEDDENDEPVPNVDGNVKSLQSDFDKLFLMKQASGLINIKRMFSSEPHSDYDYDGEEEEKEEDSMSNGSGPFEPRRLRIFQKITKLDWFATVIEIVLIYIKHIRKN